jgi:hypothetical protein
MGLDNRISSVRPVDNAVSSYDKRAALSRKAA